MIADLVTRYLSAEMGFNGKVDAIGNAAALDEIKNGKGDGKLVMMFHDMTFLSQLFGSVDEMYSLENMTVGPRIGQNPGACFGAAAEDGLPHWQMSPNISRNIRVSLCPSTLSPAPPLIWHCGLLSVHQGSSGR